MKMGYIFEELIRKFSENAEAGDHYTGRDIIKTMVSLLLAEGCDDIFDEMKEIKVLDQAAGTGGMLSVANSYITRFNPTAQVRLFSQEVNPESYAMCLAEMLIRGQNAENIRLQDTMKADCFTDTKMRFVIENPPFGCPWGGKDAPEGDEEAVNNEVLKGDAGRFPAGSPSSGESQIRRWLLENDYIEAIIQLNTDMFYNTGIATYIWILSKNKRSERVGKIQLIDASSFAHKLRKNLGNKKCEILPEDRTMITKLYSDFKENEYCQIYDNTEFIYREYSVMQPLQRSYAITKDRIDAMLLNGTLSYIYDEAKVAELDGAEELTGKDKVKLANYQKNKVMYDAIIEMLNNNISDAVYKNLDDFMAVLVKLLSEIITDAKELKKTSEKIADGLSVMYNLNNATI